MKMIKKRKLKKTKLNSGETLVETLVAMTIIAISVLLITTSITSAASIIKANRANFGEYYSGENKIAAQAATDVASSGTFTLGMTGAYQAESKCGHDTDSMIVNFFVNEEATHVDVVSYADGSAGE